MAELIALLQEPHAWASLLTLTTMEIVLGVDNLVFIAILTGRLPLEQQSIARRIGLGWAITATVLTVLLATCLPVGIGALLYARSANEKYARGDAAGGQAAERAYRRWMIASWIVVVISMYFTWQSYRVCMSFFDQLG